MYVTVYQQDKTANTAHPQPSVGMGHIQGGAYEAASCGLLLVYILGMVSTPFRYAPMFFAQWPLASDRCIDYWYPVFSC